jgi:tetratricopeptide (TPR) repeat protein
MVLNNLGAVHYFQGRWDEAVALYERAADRSRRAGKPADVAFTDCNIGEVLSDQGHYAEAERHLRRAARIWTSTANPGGAAFATGLIGRLYTRTDRGDEARELLRQSAAALRELDFKAFADYTQALLAEAEALGGSAQRAVEIVERLAGSTDPSLPPLINRFEAVARHRLGERGLAAAKLEAALTAARERASEYEIACTLDVVEQVFGLDAAATRERDEILERLHVVRLPRVPVDVSTAATLALGA